MLVRASPNYVLNEGIAKKNNYHSFISLAVRTSSAAVTNVALMSTLTDVKCNSTMPAM